MIYSFSGKRMVDIRTLLSYTNYSKSTLIRLLNKREVPFFTYQNRRIYFIDDLKNRIGDRIDLSKLNETIS